VFFVHREEQRVQSMVNKIGDSTGERWSRRSLQQSWPIDGARVDTWNAINVAMEDLVEEDRRAIERELKEEMAERRARNWHVSRKCVTASSRRRT
jgi:hypothetical protein